MKSERCKNVIFMSGAGISTSAGLPDFRSEDTGLYEKLQKFDLPNPERLFEIRYFQKRPEPFFTIVKDMFPGRLKPTPTHYFIRLLNEKKMLLRNYTQNIDSLDEMAGIEEDLIVEAHGSFKTSMCVGQNCQKEHPAEWFKSEIFAERVPRCQKCDNYVKPGVSFYGEEMPKWFNHFLDEDFAKCDLLIVAGTSLIVQPFASYIEKVPSTTPRLFINRELSGKADPLMKFLGTEVNFNFDYPDNYRDIYYLGSCDDGCYKLAELLGWKEELAQLVKTEHQRLDAAASHR